MQTDKLEKNVLKDLVTELLTMDEGDGEILACLQIPYVLLKAREGRH